MKLHAPFIITPRLMPGVAVGGGWISLGNGPRNAEGRTVYGCFIDVPGRFEHEVTDLASGVGGGVQDGMGNLLAFLGAAAESYGFEQRNPGVKSENGDLFPPEVCEWAAEFDDDLWDLRSEIEDSGKVLVEK